MIWYHHTACPNLRPKASQLLSSRFNLPGIPPHSSSRQSRITCIKSVNLWEMGEYFLPITVINNKFKRYKCKTWKYMNSSIVIFDGKENHLWVRRKQMLSKSSPDLHSHLFYSTNQGEAWQVGCSGRTSKTGNTTEWFLGTGHQDRCPMKPAHSTN